MECVLFCWLFMNLIFGHGCLRRSLPLLPLEENDKDAAKKVLERPQLGCDW